MAERAQVTRVTSMVEPPNTEEIGIYRDANLVRLAKGITESYHYETDFLAELLQNAVDAVRQTGRKRGNTVDVTYDSVRGVYQVFDNGIGMSRADLKRFALGQTGKADLSSLLIGEKGVGGSYVLLISDLFEVESVKDGARVLARCEGARDKLWSNEEPVLKIIRDEPAVGAANSTTVRVRSQEFKSYADAEELNDDLRLFTAVGNTRVPFTTEELTIDVTLSFVKRDEDGSEVKITRPVDFCFLHPAVSTTAETVSFSDLEAEAAKQGGKLSLPAGVYRDRLFVDIDTEKLVLLAFGSTALLEKLRIDPTIVLGVKGAPMPVEIKAPITGSTGYWRNVFILINKDDAELDIGRKSITRTGVLELNTRLRDLFNERVAKYGHLFIEPKGAHVAGALEQLKEQAKAKPDLNVPGIGYEKVPAKGEELSVIGVFHELIGAEKLTGYHTLSESTDGVYDAIIRYRVPLESLGKSARESVLAALRKVKDKPSTYVVDGFVEYKVDAIDFILDCDRGRKDLSQVMLVVAFDLNRKRLRKGWSVLVIPEDDRIFQGAKYSLRHEATNREVPLILLKDFRFERATPAND